MQSRRTSATSTVVLAVFTVALLVTGTNAFAQQERVLWSFNGADGFEPSAGLIFDGTGNLYGTTEYGGANSCSISGTDVGCGTVFELTPTTDGGWTEKILRSFQDNGTDGYYPLAGLIFDTAGNLYGTTAYGGLYGTGTVFELTAAAGGAWTEKVLHNFGNGEDGAYPAYGSSLIFDAAGDLYGTTWAGGAYGVGTVFELAPKEGGGWAEKILHSFNPNGKDGWQPSEGLVFDTSGNLYGTTLWGGTYGSGTLFELALRAEGGWAEKVLHNFDSNGTDGAVPWAPLIFDSVGNLYSTTYGGGCTSCVGTVFELSPKPGGGWGEKILHDFTTTGKDGDNPFAPLIFDASGDLYGTTWDGGAYDNGTVFELVPKAGGGWTERILHSFDYNAKDGFDSSAGLVFDTAGNLYGTTEFGGANSCSSSGTDVGCGTIFEVRP